MNVAYSSLGVLVGVAFLIAVFISNLPEAMERTSSRAGVAPAEVQRLSRRTVSPTDDCQQRLITSSLKPKSLTGLNS